MQLMEVITRSRPLKSIMSQPSSHCTIHNTSYSNHWVTSKGNEHQSSRVIQSRLHRVHIGSTECRRVIRFVVQAMDPFIQKLPGIHATNLPFPWMHHAMHDIEM